MEVYVIPTVMSIMVICMYLICRTDSYTKKVHKSLKDMTEKTWDGASGRFVGPLRQPKLFPIKYDDGSIKYRTPNGNLLE